MVERQNYSVLIALDEKESKELFTTNNFDEANAVGRKIVGTHVKRGENAAIIATRFAQKYNHQDVINYYNQVKSYNKVMQYFGISSKATVSFIIKQSK